VREYPAVLTTAWQSSDGKKAQFLACYRKLKEVCTVDLRATDGARLIDENGAVLETLKPSLCTIEMPPHSVRMIEFL